MICSEFLQNLILRPPKRAAPTRPLTLIRNLIKDQFIPARGLRGPGRKTSNDTRDRDQGREDGKGNVGQGGDLQGRGNKDPRHTPRYDRINGRPRVV